MAGADWGWQMLRFRRIGSEMKTKPSKQAGRSQSPVGFTLIELLVVIGIIGILASLLMPSIVRVKSKANQTKCLNHLRQLGLATTMYTDDFSNEFPTRRSRAEAWFHKLKPYFSDPQILECPSDRQGVGGSPKGELNPDRSFLMNGFNDFFMKTLSDKDYQEYAQYTWPHGMKATEVPKPSDTALFGEKRAGSRHVHVDIDQGNRGNDFEEIEHERHSKGSNFGFVDNSVRFLKKYQEMYPENLWSVRDEFRYPPAPPRF